MISGSVTLHALAVVDEVSGFKYCTDHHLREWGVARVAPSPANKPPPKGQGLSYCEHM
jgi:hypothetical protein